MFIEKLIALLRSYDWTRWNIDEILQRRYFSASYWCSMKLFLSGKYWFSCKNIVTTLVHWQKAMLHSEIAAIHITLVPSKSRKFYLKHLFTKSIGSETFGNIVLNETPCVCVCTRVYIYFTLYWTWETLSHAFAL